MSGSKVEVSSPAKINLYLNITGKYSGGYHRLESLVERISLLDKIIIRAVSSPKISITSNRKQFESKKNLIYKAAKLMQKKFFFTGGFDIYLEKKIPVGSGLGGGSSNAASTILGIKELLSLDIKKEELYALGEKIGSDVNFFLAETSYAYLSGRGQKVKPLPGLKSTNHFLIRPNFSLSTRWVYLNAKAKLTRFFSSANMVKYALKKSDFLLLEKGIYNCLEKSAFSLNKKLAEIKNKLAARGVCCFMTGSGSVLYTVGLKNYRVIQDVIPKNWATHKVQTF